MERNMIYNVESFLDARAKDLIKSKRIYLADLLSLAKLGSEVFKNPDKTKDLIEIIDKTWIETSFPDFYNILRELLN